MIRFIGISSKEEARKDILKRLKRITGFFTFSIFFLAITYFIFDFEIITSNNYNQPRHAVGQLEYNSNDGGGTCTAFLIQEDLIVTARHCVSTIYKDFSSENHTDFTINFTNAKNYANKYISANVIFSPSYENIKTFGDLYKDDIAVLKLDKLVKDIKPLKIDFAPENPLNYSPQVDIFGYQRLTSIDQGFQEGQKHLQLNVTQYPSGEENIIELEEGVSYGTSGAPVIDSKSNKVIGIVSFITLPEFKESDKYKAGGAVKAYHIYNHPESPITRNRNPK